MFRVATALCLAILGWAAIPADAQVVAGQPLKVFLECVACDFDFVRTEITYVDWVRDRSDSDLHIISRTELTGSGGRIYTLDFMGLARQAGKADTISYAAGRDDTTDTTRRGLTRLLHMGLMRYVIGTDGAAQVQIGTAPARPGTPAPRLAATRDPWNAWVFSLGGSGNLSGESSQTSTNLGASVGANRVTAAWKMNYSARGSYGRQSFSYTLGGRDTTTVSLTRSYTGTGLIVRSINGHTSIGTQLGMGTSTFGNTKFYVNAQPSIEYDLFPYSESTRQSLIFRYGVGVLSQRYREETVYFLNEETRAIHSFLTSYATRKPWGSLNVAVEGRQFFHDTGLYNLSVSGSASVNIIRGLSMSVTSSYSRIRDQIALARRNLTPEEVLLQQRLVATNFRYYTFLSFSYRFGSSLQNVVNPRFGSSGFVF